MARYTVKAPPYCKVFLVQRKLVNWIWPWGQQGMCTCILNPKCGTFLWSEPSQQRGFPEAGAGESLCPRGDSLWSEYRICGVEQRVVGSLGWRGPSLPGNKKMECEVWYWCRHGGPGDHSVKLPSVPWGRASRRWCDRHSMLSLFAGGWSAALRSVTLGAGNTFRQCPHILYEQKPSPREVKELVPNHKAS